MLSCETGMEDGAPTGPNNPNPPPGTGTTLTANEASDHLIFDDATKISGTLPISIDGQLKLDEEDTVFTVRGYHLGNRIKVRHDAAQNITGFNVQVSGSTFYLYVPETIIEDQFESEKDSVSILVVDFNPPEEVGCTYTVQVNIQPVNDGGVPLDQFTRWITLEDPACTTNCNTVTTPAGSDFVWAWDLSIREYNGDILNTSAPGLAYPINSQGAGCCVNGTISATTSDSQNCHQGTTEPGYTWVVYELDDFSTRPYEIISLKDDGTVQILSSEIKKTYDRPTTNFCNGTIGYTYDNGYYDNTGTHDFTPGGDQANFDFPNWDGPYHNRGGEVVYTCHTMIVEWGKEDNWSAVYRKRNLSDITIDFGGAETWFD